MKMAISRRSWLFLLGVLYPNVILCDVIPLGISKNGVDLSSNSEKANEKEQKETGKKDEKEEEKVQMPSLEECENIMIHLKPDVGTVYNPDREVGLKNPNLNELTEIDKKTTMNLKIPLNILFNPAPPLSNGITGDIIQGSEMNTGNIETGYDGSTKIDKKRFGNKEDLVPYCEKLIAQKKKENDKRGSQKDEEIVTNDLSTKEKIIDNEEMIVSKVP